MLRLIIRSVTALSALLVMLVVGSADAQGTGASAPVVASAEAAGVDNQTKAGIERYRAGAHREAVVILSPLVAARPDNQAAQLYLGLSLLWLGEDGPAERHLKALRVLPITPRLGAQLDYVLDGMKAGPLSPPLRRFIALALDETMSLERSPRRPPFADSLLRRNFPYVP